MVLSVMPALESVKQRVLRSARMTADRGLVQVSFEAMATHCRASFVSHNSAQAKAFQDSLLNWIAEFESRYSRFIPESLISAINREAGKGWVEIDPETERIFQLCADMNFMTRGIFDPTALPLIRLWNWKSQPAIIPDGGAVQAAKKLTGWRKVQRKPGAIFLLEEGMELDLGGIGKEYAVDIAVELARRHGIENILIDFGRDIKGIGRPPDRGAWHIGLEDPNNPGNCWTGLGVVNSAVATSGDYIRNFTIDGRRFGHIIDPRSGNPVANGCLAVSVLGPSCTLAGILATAAFIAGPEEGLKMMDNLYNVEGCVLTEKGRFPTRRFYEFVVS
jgi:thiamine biosynthesis lipoprotein